MAMTKASMNEQTKRSATDVTGAGVVSTEGEGKPSVDSGAATQSPASLKQASGPAAVSTFTGSESNANNC